MINVSYVIAQPPGKAREHRRFSRRCRAVGGRIFDALSADRDHQYLMIDSPSSGLTSKQRPEEGACDQALDRPEAD